MRSVYVNLPTTQSVQDFVNTLTDLSDDFELIADNYILDARSLLGILVLDRTKPIELKVYDDSEENLKAIGRFLVPQEELPTESERKEK